MKRFQLHDYIVELRLRITAQGLLHCAVIGAVGQVYAQSVTRKSRAGEARATHMFHTAPKMAPAVARWGNGTNMYGSVGCDVTVDVS